MYRSAAESVLLEEIAQLAEEYVAAVNDSRGTLGMPLYEEQRLKTKLEEWRKLSGARAR